MNARFFGLYGACSTCGLSLTLASLAVSGSFADFAACVTSSHFASAEKEFRFPLAYGNQRPLSASWTVTGSGAFILANAPSGHDRAMITGLTPRKNCRLRSAGFHEHGRLHGSCRRGTPSGSISKISAPHRNDYDKIVTGDLGKVGQRVLLDIFTDLRYRPWGAPWTAALKFTTAKSRTRTRAAPAAAAALPFCPHFC